MVVITYFHGFVFISNSFGAFWAVLERFWFILSFVGDFVQGQKTEIRELSYGRWMRKLKKRVFVCEMDPKSEKIEF